MKINDVICKFNISAPLPPKSFVKHKTSSAVLLPLVEKQGEAALLFCKRSAHLTHHPSQICFPGGKVEAQDNSLTDTALRETHEELGVSLTDIISVGQMPFHSTLTGFSIAPIVGQLRPTAQWHTQSSEVDSVFSLKLSDLFEPNNWQTLSVTLGGKRQHFEVFPTEQGLLWGATAKLVKNFSKLTM